MTSRPSTAAPILAVLVVVVAPLGLYVGGYFWLSNPSNWAPEIVLDRVYPYQWLATIYKPAGDIEQRVSGKHC